MNSYLCIVAKGLMVAFVVALLAGACGGSAIVPGATEAPTATVEATATPAFFGVDAGEGGDGEQAAAPTPLPIPTATAEVSATAPTPSPTTPPPIPTATTSASPTPRPTARPEPTATTAPRPTATPTVTPVPAVSCSITPQRPVGIREAVVFEAWSSPSNLAIDFRFDHGDGTIDPGARSDAWYHAPGRYQVVLRWSSPIDDGTLHCGAVTVVGDHGCWIGLGPADGVGWWCGDTFCPGHVAVQGSTVCPDEPAWGCYIGIDGLRACIGRPDPRPPVCLVGSGPADELAWYCDGHYCDPASPHTGCPPYPIFGCHPTVDGQTICIDPGPVPDMQCTISKDVIRVGEIVTFQAQWYGPEVPVEVAFHHGDGTEDRRWTATAYYTSPGNYLVTLDWSSSVGSGTTICGTVTVHDNA